MTTKEQMNYVSEFEKYVLAHGLNASQMEKELHVLEGNVKYYSAKQKLSGSDKEEFLYCKLQAQALRNLL